MKTLPEQQSIPTSPIVKLVGIGTPKTGGIGVAVKLADGRVVQFSFSQNHPITVEEKPNGI